MKRTRDQLQFLEPDWPAPKHVRAVTTTRLGGVSQPPYTSLNLGAHVQDQANAVVKNRKILSAALGLPAEPVWLEQVHGTELIELKQSNPGIPVADGSFTHRANVVCCIMTADCLPLFLSDSDGEQVAVVHVGWRGLAAGIVAKAVSLFNAPPAELLAWAGPAISQKHFEVGAEVKAQLGGDEQAWRKSDRERKFYANLYQLVANHLDQLSVGWYGHGGMCTYENDDLFFSHRRDGQSGRLASLIYKQDIT